MSDLVPAQPLDDLRAIQLWLSRFSSTETRRAYACDVRDCMQALGGKALGAVSFEDTIWYTAQLQAEYKPSSVSRKVGVLKSLYRFLSEPAVGYLTINPWYIVRAPGFSSTAEHRVLTESEVMRLLVAATNHRQRVVLWLLYYAGMRAAEVSAARWSDLVPRPDVGSGQISIRGKGGKQRVMLLPRAIWDQIVAFGMGPIVLGGVLVRSQKGGAISPSAIWRMVRGIAQRAGIQKPVSPHWLRHAHVTHALHRGCPITVVARNLGHASIQTTMRYDHQQPTESSALFLPV